jgi:hypothetical protein
MTDDLPSKRRRLFFCLAQEKGGLRTRVTEGRRSVGFSSLIALSLFFTGILVFPEDRERHIAYARQNADDGAAVCALRQDVLAAFYGEDKGGAQLSVEEECAGSGSDSSPDGSARASVEALALEQELRTLLADHPMGDMAPAIARQDRTVAAFLVGIAKKESDWGKHAPSLEGRDCYNYWGYKGAGGRGTALGYACFATSEEAVETVGGRIGHFVYSTRRDTPAEMVIWKCGSSCAGHDPEGVRKWIADVSMYYQKVVR